MRAIILLGMLCSLLSAQPREALLIGNHNYVHISDLDNPSKNLQRLKASLEEVDFNVKVETDLNSENLENAIEQFKNRLARNSNTIGFLYYTGHGCQVEYQGYLVPTNVDTQQKLKIKYNALNINQMLENLKGAGNKVNLLFLDACRDVPTGTKGGTKGLGQPLEKPIGTLLVYATEAGKVANDNSKFINALIDNISKPNQYIKDIGDNISRVVANKSNYKQIPEVFSKLLPKGMVLKRGYIPEKPPFIVRVEPKPIYVPETRRVETPTNNPNITTIGNLMWQDEPYTQKEKEAYDAHKEYDKVLRWKNAINYCKDLSLGGYTDWRVPSKDELMALYKNKNQLENVSSDSYWSSTTHASNNSDHAWSIYLSSGDQYSYSKSTSHYVRCVRAGE